MVNSYWKEQWNQTKLEKLLLLNSDAKNPFLNSEIIKFTVAQMKKASWNAFCRFKKKKKENLTNVKEIDRVKSNI